MLTEQQALQHPKSSFWASIDYAALRTQKRLLCVLSQHSPELDGILCLLDALQDHAVDAEGWDSDAVFGTTVGLAADEQAALDNAQLQLAAAIVTEQWRARHPDEVHNLESGQEPSRPSDMYLARQILGELASC